MCWDWTIPLSYKFNRRIFIWRVFWSFYAFYENRSWEIHFWSNLNCNQIDVWVQKSISFSEIQSKEREDSVNNDERINIWRSVVEQEFQDNQNKHISRRKRRSRVLCNSLSWVWEDLTNFFSTWKDKALPIDVCSAQSLFLRETQQKIWYFVLKSELNSMEDIIPVFIVVVLFTSLDNLRCDLDMMIDYTQTASEDFEAEKRLLVNFSVLFFLWRNLIIMWWGIGKWKHELFSFSLLFYYQIFHFIKLTKYLF